MIDDIVDILISYAIYLIVVCRPYGMSRQTLTDVRFIFDMQHSKLERHKPQSSSLNTRRQFRSRVAEYHVERYMIGDCRTLTLRLKCSHVHTQASASLSVCEYRVSTGVRLRLA